MKIFALETDNEKAIQGVLLEGETVVRRIHFHGARFFFACVPAILCIIGLCALVILLGYMGTPNSITLGVAGICFVIWLLKYSWDLLHAFIDWKYDFLMITNKRVVVINQTSILHKDVQKMDLENIASVGSQSQLLDLFTFGKLTFDLKEGVGKRYVYKYIADCDNVAKCISDCLAKYQAAERSHHSHE